MTTDYDPIAEQYQRSKQQPWRAHLESFTLMELAGDLGGKRVVDLACGEGFYSRLVRQRGAAAVLGVDLSQRMIELAREQEARHRLGVEYRVDDARDVKLDEGRDLALAAYLLNYASNREELAAMCRGVARCLREGGRFLTVNCNPALDFRSAPSYRKYGFEISLPRGFDEGAPISWKFHLEDGQFEIENYYLDVSTHVEAFRAAGFREVRWHRPRLSPEARNASGVEHWADFMEHPPIAFIDCTK